MVWLHRTPLQMLSDLDRIAAATAGRMTRFAWPDGVFESPRANVHVGDDEAAIEMLVPGFGPADVQLTVEGEQVIVKGERKDGTETEAEKESSTRSSFERRFELPFEIDSDRVTAKLQHGVLRVSLPRLASSNARTIHVQ